MYTVILPISFSYFNHYYEAEHISFFFFNVNKNREIVGVRRPDLFLNTCDT